MDKILLFVGDVLISISWHVGRIGHWFRFKSEECSAHTQEL